MYYSTQSKRTLKRFIGSDFAYIVPGYQDTNDVILSNFWKMPILMGKLEIHRTLSLKSGSFQFFNEINFPLPLG